MGTVIQFKNPDKGTLDSKWEAIMESMDESGGEDQWAIKLDTDGRISLHHSGDMDPFTLIGLLEIFKSRLINS